MVGKRRRRQNFFKEFSFEEPMSGRFVTSEISIDHCDRKGARCESMGAITSNALDRFFRRQAFASVFFFYQHSIARKSDWIDRWPPSGLFLQSSSTNPMSTNPRTGTKGHIAPRSFFPMGGIEIRRRGPTAWSPRAFQAKRDLPSREGAPSCQLTLPRQKNCFVLPARRTVGGCATYEPPPRPSSADDGRSPR